MDQVSLGKSVTGFILGLAQLVTLEHWPGLISLLIVAVFAAVAGVMISATVRRLQLLTGLTKQIRRLPDALAFQAGLDSIERQLSRLRNKDARRLADVFAEYRETLLEPSRHGEAGVRNAFRPATFINLDDLRFGLSGWRAWPGLFVSVGLLLTFLGLVAALAATKHSIEVGGGDQQKMMVALEGLLDTASAKFTMSLTGLACSILFTAIYRFCSGRLDHAISILNHEIERRIGFVSLEGIADRQLDAIKEQTAQQQLLNTELIAQLSKPLERMSATGVQAIGDMANELGASLTSRIGTSLDQVAEKVDGAALALNTLASSLGDASTRFEESIERSVAGLDVVIRRFELVTGQLAQAAGKFSPSSIQYVPLAGLPPTS